MVYLKNQKRTNNDGYGDEPGWDFAADGLAVAFITHPNSVVLVLVNLKW